MPDLNALLIFAEVVEANSFSEAARRLRMPASTVSRRIAELERDLNVRLLERSTRSLRLTEAGTALREHAQRSVELQQAIQHVASEHVASVQGTVRLSAPPSISDSLLAPLLVDFQARYPEVRVQVLVTERFVDLIREGVDLVFRVGRLEDSSLIARRILTYRHQLVASPAYLATQEALRTPEDLLRHRLLAFSFWKPQNRWHLTQMRTQTSQTITFQPVLSMNEYAGLATALVAGAGIGELPPIVQPELLRSGRLVEVLPNWRFSAVDLSLVHTSNRFPARPVRIFKDFVARHAVSLFPRLPA